MGHDCVRVCFLVRTVLNVLLFVQNLIRIAEYYRFDGWLINIENPIHVSSTCLCCPNYSLRPFSYPTLA